jgi:hypothetical protein
VIRTGVALALLLGALALNGCIGTVVDVVTAPVRIVGAGINTVIPGQHERDRRRGKKARKAEEAQRKADKKAAIDAARAKRDAHSR